MLNNKLRLGLLLLLFFFYYAFWLLPYNLGQKGRQIFFLLLWGENSERLLLSFYLQCFWRFCLLAEQPHLSLEFLLLAFQRVVDGEVLC